MKVKIIRVGIDEAEFDIPKGYTVVHVERNSAEWVVFIQPQSNTTR